LLLAYTNKIPLIILSLLVHFWKGWFSTSIILSYMHFIPLFGHINPPCVKPMESTMHQTNGIKPMANRNSPNGKITKIREAMRDYP